MDAMLIVRMQEEYQKKDKKLYTCFVEMEKAFDIPPTFSCQEKSWSG